MARPLFNETIRDLQTSLERTLPEECGSLSEGQPPGGHPRPGSLLQPQECSGSSRMPSSYRANNGSKTNGPHERGYLDQQRDQPDRYIEASRVHPRPGGESNPVMQAWSKSPSRRCGANAHSARRTVRLAVVSNGPDVKVAVVNSTTPATPNAPSEDDDGLRLRGRRTSHVKSRRSPKSGVGVCRPRRPPSGFTPLSHHFHSDVQ